MIQVSLRALTFSFPTATSPIINDLTTTFSRGFTGLIGPNGCGKSTLLQLLSGGLIPQSGSIIGLNGLVHYCAQQTSQRPEGLDEFLESYDKTIIGLKTSLHLHEFIHPDWERLSPGEQKRFQLALALSKRPDVLLIDEPTNHLDSQNRNFIIAALSAYGGIGVLVSHDRTLLNAITSKCLFFVGEKILEVAGNYDQAKKELDEKFAYFKDQKENLKRSMVSLSQEVNRLERLSDSSQSRLSKRGIDAKDHDQKGKIDAARLTGKDKSFDQKKQNLNRRIDRLEEAAKTFATKKDYSGPIFFANEKRPEKVLLHLEAGRIPLGGEHWLSFPELVIRTRSKVALTGLNGVGKSTLIRHLVQGGLKHCFYLSQELGSAEIQALREKLQDLDPNDYALVFQIVARLGSSAAQVLKSETMSPGEARKVAIALAIVKGAEFLILDEPTNHLDLPSIVNLTEALQESDLALLIVSHDAEFLASVANARWHIIRSEGANAQLEVDP